MALLLWYGGLRVLDETLTVGVLAAFIQYTRRFFQPLQDLSEKFNLLQSAMASSERVFALLDEPVTVPEPAQPGDAAAAGAGRGPVRGGVVPLLAGRPLGAEGHLLHRAAGPNARAGGAHGGGEDDDRQPAAPVLRPGAGPDHGGRGGHPRPLDRRPALGDRVRAAGPLPLHRRHPATTSRWAPRSRAERPGRRRERVGRRPVHRAAARPATSIGWASGAEA